jgi:cytochrome c2
MSFNIDCHRNKNEPEYTLASKANERWVDHNFDLNDKLKTINDCLLCHSVEKGGREGSIAPTTLRTIVHQTHKSNSRFEGNCFTCHYIMGDSSSDLYNYQN